MLGESAVTALVLFCRYHFCLFSVAATILRPSLAHCHGHHTN